MSTLCYHSGYNQLYAIADTLHWLLAMSGVKHLFHYFDGYIIIAQPQSQYCKSQLSILMYEYSRLGVPIAGHKTEGPTTNSDEWSDNKDCTSKELESLIDHLYRPLALKDRNADWLCDVTRGCSNAIKIVRLWRLSTSEFETPAICVLFSVLLFV